MNIERLLPFLAQSIRNRREQQQKSLEAMANETGFSAEYLEFIESGATNFSIKTLNSIATALSTPPSELIAAAEELAGYGDES